MASKRHSCARKWEVDRAARVTRRIQVKKRPGCPRRVRARVGATSDGVIGAASWKLVGIRPGAGFHANSYGGTMPAGRRRSWSKALILRTVSGLMSTSPHTEQTSAGTRSMVRT